MKLELAARFVEIVAEIDSLVSEMRAGDETGCPCSTVGAAALSQEARVMSSRMVPFIFAHASAEDTAALTALTAQLMRERASGGGPS